MTRFLVRRFFSLRLIENILGSYKKSPKPQTLNPRKRQVMGGQGMVHAGLSGTSLQI